MNKADHSLDLLIIGSGVAGLSAAKLAQQTYGMSVGVLTKGELTQTNTRWAQGGVAAVMSPDVDSTDLHLADTLAAGAGLCDVEAVRVLVEDGPKRVAELIEAGTVFDRGTDGEYLLAREGGHSLARILHAGGAATGAEVERSLAELVLASATAVHEETFVVDLIVRNDRCVGVVALDSSGQPFEVLAAHVLIATGGSGQLYAVTTNPAEATGDGVAMALRAGVAVGDLEFMQFHPSALHHPSMPRPLLSEALRGHGAFILDTNGERFVDELLPRDQVSRAMLERMRSLEVDHCFLDARHLEQFTQRFPSIYRLLRDVGLDPGVDLLPIAPAAHYHCGGIITDLNGATTLRGLWAAGETAASGVHGANRLASNSLLEGMVFGYRAVEAIASGQDGPKADGAMRALVATVLPTSPRSMGAEIGVQWLGRSEELLPRSVITSRTILSNLLAQGDPGFLSASELSRLGKLRERFAVAMSRGAGVARNPASLASVISEVSELASQLAGEAALEAEYVEMVNLLEVGSALAVAASARHESRGCHLRTDLPASSDQLRVRMVLGDAGLLQRSIRPPRSPQGRLNTQ